MKMNIVSEEWMQELNGWMYRLITKAGGEMAYGTCFVYVRTQEGDLYVFWEAFNLCRRHFRMSGVEVDD